MICFCPLSHSSLDSDLLNRVTQVCESILKTPLTQVCSAVRFCSSDSVTPGSVQSYFFSPDCCKLPSVCTPFFIALNYAVHSCTRTCRASTSQQPIPSKMRYPSRFPWTAKDGSLSQLCQNRQGSIRGEDFKSQGEHRTASFPSFSVLHGHRDLSYM